MNLTRKFQYIQTFRVKMEGGLTIKTSFKMEVGTRDNLNGLIGKKNSINKVHIKKIKKESRYFS